jgi:hypothetical protein
MKKVGFFLLVFFCTIIFLCSCKDDTYLSEFPPVSNQSFTEEFDTLQNAYNRGWRFINRSLPIGAANVGNWKQGASFRPIRQEAPMPAAFLLTINLQRRM